MRVRVVGTMAIAMVLAVGLIAPASAHSSYPAPDHPPMTGEPPSFELARHVPVMNQPSYWERYFRAESFSSGRHVSCYKTENDRGRIDAKYDAVVVSDGRMVRVYPDLTNVGRFQAKGATNPANGRLYSPPHSHIMRCTYDGAPTDPGNGDDPVDPENDFCEAYPEHPDCVTPAPPMTGEPFELPRLVPVMNQPSYWENYFREKSFSGDRDVTCFKTENDRGLIEAKYDAAVVSDGVRVRVYPNLPDEDAQARGAINPANGQRYSPPHSHIMRCTYDGAPTPPPPPPPPDDPYQPCDPGFQDCDPVDPTPPPMTGEPFELARHVPVMNQPSYWENYFREKSFSGDRDVTCFKTENDRGLIEARFDAAVVSDGVRVRVYPNLPDQDAQARGAINPANGQRYSPPHSHVMRCTYGDVSTDPGYGSYTHDSSNDAHQPTIIDKMRERVRDVADAHPTRWNRHPRGRWGR